MWYTAGVFGHFDSPPPARPYVPALSTNVPYLLRWKTVTSYNVGSPVDSGWSDWSPTGVTDWLSSGYAIRSGSSFTKTECSLEVHANIGRPWRLMWVLAEYDVSTGLTTYTSPPEDVTFLPGDTASFTFDAADGKQLTFGGAALLLPYAF